MKVQCDRTALRATELKKVGHGNNFKFSSKILYAQEKRRHCDPSV